MSGRSRNFSGIRDTHLLGAAAVFMALTMGSLVLLFMISGRRPPHGSTAGGSGTPAAPRASVARNRSLEAVVAQAERSVVLVRTPWGRGSGFVVGTDLVVTNYHVVRGAQAEDIHLLYPALDQRVREVTRIRYLNRSRDVCLLETSTPAPALELAASGSRRGGEVIAIGNPSAGGDVLPNALSRGVMSLETIVGGQSYYQLGLSANPGNSGGPALDGTGAVLGMVTSRSGEGIALCVPAPAIRQCMLLPAMSADECLAAALSDRMYQAARLHVQRLAWSALARDDASDLVRARYAEAERGAARWEGDLLLRVDEMLVRIERSELADSAKATVRSQYQTAEDVCRTPVGGRSTSTDAIEGLLRRLDGAFPGVVP